MNRHYTILLSLGAACLSGCTQSELKPVESAALPSVRTSDAELAVRVDSYFAPLVRTHDLSGTLRIERDGAAVVVRHFGFADWTRPIPHSDQTRYSAASVTKGITAAALISLVRERTLSLDDPVARWLPNLSDQPAMTLRKVVRHRAGLPRDFPDDFSLSDYTASDWLAAHPDQIGEKGEESYSNVGYALLAEVISTATGEPFAHVAEARVLTPAGMTDSYVRRETADAYANGAMPYTAGPEPTGIMSPPPANLETGPSGLITTAADLAKWARYLADGNYPELFEGADPLGSIDADSDEYGEYVSVQGTLPGYVATATAWRDRDLTVAFTGNLFSFPALTIHKDLRALVGQEAPARPEGRPDAVALTADHLRLIGDHPHADFGSVRIIREPSSGGLLLTVPGRPKFWSFHLTPIANGAVHWRAFDYILALDAEGKFRSSPR